MEHDYLINNLKVQVHNFSHRLLTNQEQKLLSLSLNFRPTTTPIVGSDLNNQLKDFARSIRLMFQFAGSVEDPNFNPRLYVKNQDYEPYPANLETENSLKGMKAILGKVVNLPKNWDSNMSSDMRLAIMSLKLDKSIKVLDSDKNLGPVVVNSSWYTDQCIFHLSDLTTYRPLSETDFISAIEIARSHLELIINRYEKFLPDGEIPQQHSDFLFSNFGSLQPAGFRIIPKIHKTPLQVRPIVMSHNFCLAPCSVYVDEHLKTFLPMLPTILRDTTELLNTIQSLDVPPDCFLVTGDVCSLYTNISVEDAIIAIDSICRDFKLRETPLIIEMLRFILMNNYLRCAELDQIYKQIWGIATGTPAAVSISQIYMFWLEKPLLEKYKTFIVLYKRFIDDINLIWNGPRVILEQFKKEFDELDKSGRIKVKWVTSCTESTFLDLVIYKPDDISSSHRLNTRTYQKPLNVYAYIPSKSFHPSHTKKAFIRGELIRYIKNSSEYKDFRIIKALFWTRLRRRGYSSNFLQPIFESVSYDNRASYLLPRMKKFTFKKRSVYFKTTYNSKHLRIGKIIKQLFPDLTAMVSYKKTKTLRNFLA